MENNIMPTSEDELAKMMQLYGQIHDADVEYSDSDATYISTDVMYPVSDFVGCKRKRCYSDGESSGVNSTLEDRETEEGYSDFVDSGKRKKVTPPHLPEEFTDAMWRMAADGKNLTEVKLVIQKTLVPSDCCHLTITVASWSFLTGTDMEHLKGCNADDHADCVLVKILDPNLDVIKGIHLRKLNKGNDMTMSTSVLDGSWHSIVKMHRLEEDMDVQLWSFKIEEKFHFALVKLP